MRLSDVIPFLAVLLVLVGLVAAVGGVVYLVLRLRAGEHVSFPMRLLFRLYLYIITLISLVMLVMGLSNLVQAGLGQVLGKDFSYTAAYVATPIPATPDQPKGQPAPTDQAVQEAQRQTGLTLAMKQGLLDGLSLTIVGAAVLGLHVWGRRRLESPDERRDILHRVYLILLLVVFGVITLVTLPSAIYGSLRYAILDTTRLDFSNRPGESLATAIVALPVWGYYLQAIVATLRKADADQV